MPKVQLLEDSQIDSVSNRKVDVLDDALLGATIAPDTALTPRPAPVEAAPDFISSVQGFEAADIGRAIENAPAEVSEVAGLIKGAAGQLIDDPVSTIQQFGKQQFREFVGAPRALLDFLGLVDAEKMEDPLNTLEAGRDVGRAIEDVVTDPRKQIVENPIMSVLSIAGLKGLTRSLSTANLLKGVDAVDLTDVADVKVLPLIDKATKAVGRSLSKNAGVGSLAGETAVEIGAEGLGSVRKKAFKRARRGDVDEEVTRITGDVADAVEQADDLRALNFQDATKQLSLKDMNKPIDPREVKKSFQDIVGEKPQNMKLLVNDEGGITIDPHDGIFADSVGELTDEGKRIQEAINIVWKWQDNSIDGAHTMQRRLDKLIAKGIDAPRFTDSNRILTQIRRNLKDHLVDRVEGYGERADDYAAASRFLKLTRQALGVTERHGGLDEVGIVSKLNVIPEKVLTRVGQLLNDRLNNNLGTRRAIVTELDRVVEAQRLKKAGVDIADMDGFQISQAASERGLTSTFMDELAGVRFSETNTQGIRGAINARGVGVGAPIGAATFFATQSWPAAVAASSVASLINTYTFANPRAVGSMLLSLGANARRASDVTKAFQNVKDFAIKTALPAGLAFGPVMEKMFKNDRKEYRQTMKLLGAVDSKNPLDVVFQPPASGQRQPVQ